MKITDQAILHRKSGEVEWRSPRFNQRKGNRARPNLKRVHLQQELSVVPSLPQPVHQQFHGLDRRQRIEHLTQHPNPLQIFLGNQQLFLTRTGPLNVDRREHPLIHQLAIQDDFHVAGTLELFEDDFVHA